ncbi:hypothetical protein [Bradyrhizobium sp.]|uniref:hypothetical protein n=1 Tax=Bradyrhizobium sp. TaxID=376 RepID=UPI003C707123
MDRRLGGLPASLEAKLDALIEATSAMTAAIGAMAKVMAAPKMITTDDAGRPVGVKVDA